MRKVFLVLSKKTFWFGWGVRLGEARKVGVFSVFWPILTRPGRQSHGPKFWLKLVLETRHFSASIDPLLDLLACLEPKLWPKNPILPQKSKNAWASHSRLHLLAITRENAPLYGDNELYEASKDSWSLLVCTKKKHFRFWFGVFGGWGLKKGSFDFFFIVSLWRHRPHKGPKFWL